MNPSTASRALIVGCGDIALASARLIGRRHPLLLIDIDPARLQQARDALRGEGYAAESAVCDITDPASVAAVAGSVGENGLGVIAHVAALAPSCEDWRRLMTVNLIGPHLVARAFGPKLAPGGAAVIVGSVAGHSVAPAPDLLAVLADPLAPDFLARLEAAAPGPMTPSLAYRLSKTALLGFCEQLAVAWGPRNVRAVSVSPGLILSAMGARERAHNPASKALAGKTPLKREGEVAEAAAVIDFAASPAASFLNGVDILVDGGLRAAGRVAALEAAKV